MPETKRGKKILRKMQKTYGSKKGKSVFYASINKGKISGTGTDTERRKKRRKKGRTKPAAMRNK